MLLPFASTAILATNSTGLMTTLGAFSAVISLFIYGLFTDAARN
jgi:hypothetical protein